MITTDTLPETSLLARPIKRLAQFVTGSPDPLPDDDHSDVIVTDTLEVLVQPRRRATLAALAATEQTPLSVSALAERVASAEYDCEPTDLASDQRRRVYVALCQSHLPRLAETNIVSYDRETQLVDRDSQFGRVWRTYVAVLESLPLSY